MTLVTGLSTGVYPWGYPDLNGIVDARYVQVSGDNMTGNLTLGTWKNGLMQQVEWHPPMTLNAGSSIYSKT